MTPLRRGFVFIKSINTNMNKRLLDYDPITGKTQWFHYDPTTDTTTIQTQVDTSPVIEANKQVLNDSGYWGRAMKKDSALGVKVGSIPLALLEKWKNEEGIDYTTQEGLQRVMARLNDPEYKYLRVVDKKL